MKIIQKVIRVPVSHRHVRLKKTLREKYERQRHVILVNRDDEQLTVHKKKKKNSGYFEVNGRFWLRKKKTITQQYDRSTLFKKLYFTLWLYMKQLLLKENLPLQKLRLKYRPFRLVLGDQCVVHAEDKQNTFYNFPAHYYFRQTGTPLPP